MSEAQVVLAACLAVGPEAVASHLTAARLWRLELPEPEVIELTTPPRARSRIEGLRHHRLARLSLLEVQVGHRTFHPDLAYPEAQIGIEFDGWDAHGAFEAFHGDRERSRLLVAAGWRLLHLTAGTAPADLVRDVRALRLRRAG